MQCLEHIGCERSKYLDILTALMVSKYFYFFLFLFITCI